MLDKNALVELRSTVPSLEDHIVRGMRHYDHIEMFTSMAMAPQRARSRRGND